MSVSKMSGISKTKMSESGVSKTMMSKTGVSKTMMSKSGVSKMSKTMSSISKMSKTVSGVSKMSKTMSGVSNMVDSTAGGEGDCSFGFMGDGGKGGVEPGNLVGGSAQISVASSAGLVSSDGYGHGGFVVVESVDITLLPLFDGFGGGSDNMVSEESVVSQTVSVSKTVMGITNVAKAVSESVSISKMSKTMMGVSAVVGVHSNGVDGVDSVGEVRSMGGCHGGEGQAQEN